MSRQVLLVSIFFLSLIFPRLGSAQGSYLPRGESGLVVDAGYLLNSEFKGGRATAGLSVSGIYDLQLSVGRLSLDKKLNGRDVSAWTISPRITFHVLKQDTREMPVSLAVTAAYESDSYSSETLDQRGWEWHSNSYSLGVFLYRDLPISSSATVQPRLMLGHVMGRSIVDQGYGWTRSVQKDVIEYGVEVSLFINTQQNADFFVRPGVIVDDENTTVSIRAGLIIPFRH